MSKRNMFGSNGYNGENTPFLFISSIITATLLIISAMLGCAVLFRVSLLGLIIAPFFQAFFGEKIDAWFEHKSRAAYTNTDEEKESADKVSKILED